MHDFGVYIGRFQPFHLAHLETVRFALKHCKQLIIVIGSDRQARTTKNPWTGPEREAMIDNAIFDDVGQMLSSRVEQTKLRNETRDRITYVLAQDYLYNDNLWLTAVQTKINEVTGGSKDVVLFGHKKDASSFYLKLFPQWEFSDTNFHPGLSATKIRDLYFMKDKISIKSLVAPTVYNELVSFMDTPEYARLHEEHHHILSYKADWVGAPFKPVFVTTDAIVVKSGHVLVVRRRGSPGKGLIALPGGFLQQNEKIVDGCVRELKEETGIKIPTPELKDAICDQRVFDHPDRSMRGRTITHAFCINLGQGDLPQVKGMDDADKAWWMPLRDVFSRENEFFEDHFHIINYFITRF